MSTGNLSGVVARFVKFILGPAEGRTRVRATQQPRMAR
jgi:hypothetical protein